MQYFIIIYPYKVNQFVYNTFEIEHLKKCSNIYLLDISMIANKNFTKALSYDHIEDNETVIVIRSWRFFIKTLFRLRSEIKYSKLNIIDETPFDPNLKELFANILFRFIFRKKNRNTIKILNHGIPIIEEEKETKSKNKISILLNRIINKYILIYDTFLLAGKKYELLYSKLVLGKKILKGSTNDFSQSLIDSNKSPKTLVESSNYAVFIDGAGPLFTSDSFLLKTKIYFSVENWYPSLSSFFDFVESKTNKRVHIAGHYKSKHPEVSPYFGNRNVFYDKTKELIKNCSFVITRNSTAISYAVIYNKPIIFICSNETICDLNQMVYINYLVNILNSKLINIDDYKTDLNFKEYLMINRSSYGNFKYNYLTSCDSQNLKPNFQVLLQNNSN